MDRVEVSTTMRGKEVSGEWADLGGEAVGISWWQDVWRRYKRNRAALISSGALIALYLMMILAVIAPDLIMPYDPTAIPKDLSGFLESPSREHWLGTDEVGRDELSRIIDGSKISLTIGLAAMAFSLAIGIPIGAIAGFYGGTIDNLLMRFVDLMLSFPQLPLLLILAVMVGTSFWGIAAFLGIFGWMTVARLVRADFLWLREREFIEAARAIGAPARQIILRHLLPNSMAPILVAATLGVADAILMESWLSFLGWGIRPPQASWGNMLTNAQTFVHSAIHLAIFPGLFITITVLCFNFIGDGLREALDPRLRE